MPPSSLTDTLGFEFVGGERPPLRPLLLRTVILNQALAVPVALVMIAVDGTFWRMLGIATIYSQTIGLTCALAAWLVFAPVSSLRPAMRRWLMIGQYFVCGVAGAEAARRLCAVLFRPIEMGPPLVSWAIGASIAVIVGGVLMTVRHLRARVLSNELEALQARINPHFLFNTLNSIAALIREDPQRAEAMTLQLSSLFRYTLQAPRRGLVTLEEEAVIVEGYLAIEQERLADRLRYSVNLDAPLLKLEVPALILQPIVENAVKHGIANSVRGGEVIVRGWIDEDMAEISVMNSGDGGGSAEGTGEGLENVRRRLRAAFGARAGITLRRAHERTEARLFFPVRGRR
ncbi:MAG TPA: histidine kinase [Vicinamibacterales bacterium]|nr:histidine kinase [Vicinamibacterales bacterium]